MKILSLFDGVSCARLALEANGIKVDKYYASEIDKYAVKVTQANRPDTIQLGSVIDLHLEEDIDLLIGGSPCQDLSIAKKDRKGLSGDRSSLFYEYVRILNEIKPKYFILENVASMPKEAKQTITEELFGIKPVMINASLVSAQNRKRLFWVGMLQSDDSYKQVKIPQPEDKGILLKDVLENGFVNRHKSYCLDANYYKGTSAENYIKKGRRQIVYNQYNDRVLEKKCGTLGTCLSKTSKQGYLVVDKSGYRKLTPVECERLQSMPDNWTNPTGDISNTQRYKMCGNAFNVQVVAHILKYIL
jgi:DNA-cytosine methyltransferase